MLVLICDDDNDCLLQLEKLCRNFFERRDIEAEIISISEAEKIMEWNPDILLLDIEMPGIDGITVKDSLCRQSEKPLIIFVSSHNEYMPNAFGRNVINFITKPATQFHIDASLETAISLLPKGIVISLDSGKTIISGNIAYVTVAGVYTDIYLASGEILENQRRSLAAWTSLLQDFDFIRISDQCLVNCRYIDDIDREKVVLEDGLGTLKISRRRKTECKDYYRSYCRKVARLV